MTIRAADTGGVPDDAWRDVMRQVEVAYADLIAHQTELERNNADLEEMRGFMESVLGAMSDALIVCDRHGGVERTNRALRALALREPSDKDEDLAPGAPVEGLIAEADRETLRRALAAASSRPADSAATELRFATGAMAEVKIAARRDPRGRLLGYVLIGRPIGELRRAYRELEDAHEALKQAQSSLMQAEKMASLGRLVAGVAHELNNPISYVNGNVHSIARYLKKLETYFQRVRDGAAREELVSLRGELRLDRAVEGLRETVDGAIEGAERVAEIVDSLKRFSADGTGAPQAFDLAEIARVAAQWVRKGSRPEARFQVTAPKAVMVEGRAGHIQQVLMNLLENAADAHAEAGRETAVKIEVVQEGDGARLTVTDDGPGLSAEAEARLFDPFFSTKPVGHGTGLGLSICFKIVQEHGGALTAANRPEGGAVFALCLPAYWAGPAQTGGA
ncbi:MAG: ATP-binding protein [Pseudomonadota bacterium]